MDDIQHTRGEPCLLEDLSQSDRAQRGPLRRLQHEGIARDYGQRHHPQRDHDGKVEGGDPDDHPQGVAIQILVHASGDLPQRPALKECWSPACEIDHLDAASDFATGLIEGLAMVTGDEGRQLFKVFLQQRFIAEHQPRAFHYGGARPSGIRFSRGCHGLCHLRGSGERDLVEHVFRGRVVDGECWGVWLAPVAGDQIGNHGRSS
jgi:hypothetical protein